MVGDVVYDLARLLAEGLRFSCVPAPGFDFGKGGEDGPQRAARAEGFGGGAGFGECLMGFIYSALSEQRFAFEIGCRTSSSATTPACLLVEKRIERGKVLLV